MPTVNDSVIRVMWIYSDQPMPWSLVKGVDGGPSGTGWYRSAAMR
jgi:hypothetical protein